MEVINGTLDAIDVKYDGQRYVFGGKEVTTISEAAGTFLLRKHKHLGLREVKYGDDADQVMLTCLQERYSHFQRMMGEHDRAQRRQKKKEFDPLPDSAAVVEARRQIPHYEKAIAKLKEKVGGKEEEEHNQAMKELIDKDVEAPEMADASIEDLRAEARARGLDFKPQWTRKRLLKALEEQAAS